MSPSMPIDIVTLSSSSSSSASSPTSTSSSSSAGVYVPVHRRVPSASSTSTPSSKPQLPIYTPAQLLHLAHSPLVKAQVGITHNLLRDLHSGEEEDNVLARIALSRKQMRAREYVHRNPVVPGTNAHNATAPAPLPSLPSTVAPAPAPASTAARRRPLPGRAAERTAFNTRRPGTPTATRNTNKFMDAASWRPQAVVPVMQGRHVPALVI
ncbi:hypothetical protein C8R45DRAFT_1072818 [Mycena sanguinolenta]|nr:hypothetical protein C8R45DRAFT_1072818 [Mycena sanguinolenta]